MEYDYDKYRAMDSYKQVLYEDMVKVQSKLRIGKCCSHIIEVKAYAAFEGSEVEPLPFTCSHI